MKATKIFFDTEFTGLVNSAKLISIGLVAENGETFYAELNDYDKSSLNDWLQENVIAHLYCTNGIGEDNPNYHYGSKAEISAKLAEWFCQFEAVELVSDVCQYDMVLLADIFGGAFSIPENVCSACYDINQDIARQYGISLKEAFDKSREEILTEYGIVIQGNKHNALYDAEVIKELYRIVNS